MTKIARIILPLLVLALMPVLTLPADTVLDSRISSVTVYSDRAVVERSAVVSVKSGEQRVVFDSLPAGTDPQSLQIRVSSGVILSDLVFQKKYLKEVPDAKIAELSAIKENREAALQAESDKIIRLRDEKAFLNKIITKVTTVTEGSEAELNPDEWIKMITFYRERLAELDTRIRESEKMTRSLKTEIEQVTRELNDLMAGRTKEIRQAVAVINIGTPGEVSLTLTYAVLGPNWYPVYDLRVDSGKKILELTYYATVSQNTGEDWKNVPLTLSTAKPDIGGTMPELDPWYLGLHQNRRDRYDGDYEESKSESAVQMFNMMEESVDSLTGVVADESGYGQAKAKTGAVAVLFEVPGGSTIESDNNAHKIGIMTRSFPASFRYAAVPKLTPYAYLKAKVKNDTEFPLLPGTTKIFLDGNFVSTGSLPLVAPTEEFWTYLGIDESVEIKYKLVRKYDSEEGFIGKKKRTVFEYETVIKNKKGYEIEIVIFDQLPVSTDERIIVKLIEPKYTKDTEVLKKSNTDIFEWIFNLKPSGETVIKFSFSVEYPSDQSLTGM
jgi:uncharacterized protein (TIGR02231 family)